MTTIQKLHEHFNPASPLYRETFEFIRQQLAKYPAGYHSLCDDIFNELAKNLQFWNEDLKKREASKRDTYHPKWHLINSFNWAFLTVVEERGEFLCEMEHELNSICPEDDETKKLVRTARMLRHLDYPGNQTNAHKRIFDCMQNQIGWIEKNKTAILAETQQRSFALDRFERAIRSNEVTISEHAADIGVAPEDIRIFLYEDENRTDKDMENSRLCRLKARTQIIFGQDGIDKFRLDHILKTNKNPRFALYASDLKGHDSIEEPPKGHRKQHCNPAAWKVAWSNLQKLEREDRAFQQDKTELSDEVTISHKRETKKRGGRQSENSKSDTKTKDKESKTPGSYSIRISLYDASRDTKPAYLEPGVIFENLHIARQIMNEHRPRLYAVFLAYSNEWDWVNDELEQNGITMKTKVTSLQQLADVFDVHPTQLSQDIGEVKSTFPQIIVEINKERRIKQQHPQGNSTGSPLVTEPSPKPTTNHGTEHKKRSASDVAL